MKIPRRVLNSVQDIAEHLGHVYDLIEKAEPWRFVQAIGTTGSSDPLFINGWANNGAGAQTVAFRKNILGLVEIRGECNSPAVAGQGNGTTIFQLPEEYRPSLSTIFTCVGKTGLGADQLTEVQISPGGNVIPTVIGVAANAQVNIKLGNIMFRP